MGFGINGFGRIGRMLLRIACEKNVDILAINDPFVDTEYMVYLFVHDSVHGKFKGDVSHEGNNLIINGKKISVFTSTKPELIPWGEVGVDVVFESTGVFTSLEKAQGHITGGAKKVIISAPSPDAPMYVMGVNHKEYPAKKDNIISNASCTTNCLAPFAKVLQDNIGIEEALMTTVHSYTATQLVVDGPSRKKWRDGRAAAVNIIPSTTGAAGAVGIVCPELKGKVTGIALRVPTPNVSVVVVSIRFVKDVTFDEINKIVDKASAGPLKGIMGVSKQPCVSSDFIGDPHSLNYDPSVSSMLSSKFGQFVLWYDNEWGFSTRMVELAQYIMSCN